MSIVTNHSLIEGDLISNRYALLQNLHYFPNCFRNVFEKNRLPPTDTGLHNSWVRNNGTTQHNFCWFHCWVPNNPHQLMFIQGWGANISNQQLGNQQLVSSWSAWLLGTQLLGCAAFDPTLDQTFQILSLFVELVSKI